jgi:4-carboxymuconolactone decarboxylase
MVRREELDDAGKELFDSRLNDPRSLVGLRGPGGIRLHNPTLSRLTEPLNRYLRFDAGLDRRLVEIAILATAREFDQHFEWCAHEPVALKEGVEPEIIETIRLRRPLDGLGEKEAALIGLVREAIGEHRVRSETFATALRLFGQGALLNFVALIGNYAETAILLTVFDQQLPEGKTSTLPV